MRLQLMTPTRRFAPTSPLGEVEQAAPHCLEA